MEKMTKDGKRVNSIKKDDKKDDNYEDLNFAERLTLTIWAVILIVVTFYFWS
jgi:hypothetical protein